jgi:hypothetical protein
MFKKDIDLINRLHLGYNFKGPLLDAGGLSDPVIADYDISAAKALRIPLADGRTAVWPHAEQNDRYLRIHRPWSFIDPCYVILNPDHGDPYIEQLPEKYPEYFETVILVSVFEHVSNPYEISDALFKIIKPGGYLINSTPFIFPHHPSPEDNWRFSPLALRRVHEKSGFTWIEGDFHVNYLSSDGVGDLNPAHYSIPQAIMASYALCRKK